MRHQEKVTHEKARYMRRETLICTHIFLSNRGLTMRLPQIGDESGKKAEQTEERSGEKNGERKGKARSTPEKKRSENDKNRVPGQWNQETRRPM